jgi:hypothetical protein
MSQLIDAYVAGLIDGEGCIYVGRRKNAFWPQVDTGMTKKALPLLKSMQTEYGGSLTLMRDATDRWEEAWTWALYGQRAAVALKRWIPYLRLKKDQAELAIKVSEIRDSLEYGATGKRATWTNEAVERCQSIHRRIQELNRKGPSSPMDTLPPGAKLIALHVAGQFVSPQRSMFDDLQWAPFSGPWPSAGLMTQSGVYAMPNISEFPRDAVVCSLSQVLQPAEDVDQKYYLSPRAATGILRRAAKRGKELPAHLAAALTALVSSEMKNPS